MYAINDELCHHGILGMKWGVRRFQNKDGTLTAQGKKHLDAYKTHKNNIKKMDEEVDKLIKKDKRLQRDYGKASNIDDIDMFDLSLQEYKIEGKSFYEAKKNYYLYSKNNSDSIKKGRKIYERLIKN